MTEDFRLKPEATVGGAPPDSRRRDDPLIATASQTVGPFFHFCLTAQARSRLTERLRGEPITLTVRVTDGDGRPVDDAAVEVMQDGVFGRMATDPDGRCTFETARPLRPDGDGGRQAPHLYVCLFARGLLRQLHTRIYFEGDPALERDPVLALVPAQRRATLLATADAGHPGSWTFHLRLQGERETVFFDE